MIVEDFEESQGLDHEEPPPHRRVYFRHERTGDRGYLVRQNGREKIRLDRPNEVIIRDKSKAWLQDDDARKFSPAQAAQVAFEADRKLCALLGDFERSRKEWHGLLDRERRAWMQRGPKAPDIRAELYQAVMQVMYKYSNFDE